MVNKKFSKFIGIPKSSALSGIVYGVVILLTRLNIFQNQFVKDDYDYIVNWPLIQNLGRFADYFIHYVPHPGQEGIYSPLKTLFHALSYHLFGLNPFGYHVLSLLIHLSAAVFVFKIVQRLVSGSNVAFLAGLLFSLHPVQVEAITYMTASIDMAGVVFMFISFYWFIRYWSEGQRRPKDYWLSLVFALLAVFTHELMISIPILFAWYLFCVKKVKLGKMAVSVWPYAGIVLFYVACKYSVLGDIARGPYVYGSFYLTMLIILKAFAKYVFIVLFPITLTHNHVISQGIFSFDHADFDQVSVLSQSFFDWQVLISVLVLSFLAYMIKVNIKLRPVVAFCIGWFYLSLLPVSNIIPSSVYFAERYLYPGMLGFCLLLAMGINALIRLREEGKVIPPYLGQVCLIMLIGFYSGRTLLRNKDWKNEIVFYESAIRSNPKSALMRSDLGIIYTEFGDIPRAIESFNQSLAIQPRNPETYYALSEAYTQARMYTQAIEALEKSIELNPDYAESYYNLAGLYHFLNAQGLSKQYLDKSILIYRAQGRVEEAKELEDAFNQYLSEK